MFWSISGARQYLSGVAQAISFNEIKAWSEVMQCQIEPYEVQLIKSMDLALVANINNRTKAKT